MRKQSDRIFAAGIRVDNDTWLTGRNNNDIIIGPSGAGKTTGYVLPNVLNSQESMVVVDTKGNLYHKTADRLRQKGYNVLLLDFADLQHSPVGYNPLDFIRRDENGEPNEQDIMAASAAILPDEAVGNDPFWSRISRLVLETSVAYVLEYTSDTTLTSVADLLAELTTGRFDRLFAEIGEIAPDSLCYRRYAMWRNMRQAEKMTASVAGIVGEALAVLTSRSARGLYENPARVNFYDLAERKTAVFLNVSDSDPSQYKLVNLFYTQILHTLCNYADRCPGNRLPIPVRLYLDDFASNLVVADFPKTISVIRSREIYVSIMLQSITQLTAMYGDSNAKTVIANCDHCLLLGCADVDTARYFSVKANVSLHRILDMSLDSAWYFERGSKAREVAKVKPDFTLDDNPKTYEPAA